MVWSITTGKLEEEVFSRQGEGDTLLLTTRSACNLPLLAILFFALPPGAQACGMCGYATFWRFLPPVVSWSVIALVWFLAYSLVSTHHRDEAWQDDKWSLVYLPGMPKGLIWVVLAAVLSPLILGPIATLPFFIPCFINFSLSLRSTPVREWSPKLILYLRVTGGIALVALACTGVMDVISWQKMDQADVILKWDGTVPSLHAFQDLKKQEPDSIPLYRKIVREGENYVRSMSAQRLAEIGNREEDVPLLIEALVDEYRREPCGDHYAAKDISEALQKMTGIDLPREATPEVWREKWNALQGGHTAGEAVNQQ